MKKLTILIILTITLAMIVPFTSAASAPRDNQPVSWVSWKANLTPKICESLLGYKDHMTENLMVMKLSDETIVGHIEFKYLETGTTGYCIKINSAEFTGETAVIVGLFVDPAWGGTLENPIEERYTLIDSGEPAIGNDMIGIEVNLGGFWFSPFGPTGPIVTHQNIQVHNGE